MEIQTNTNSKKDKIDNCYQGTIETDSKKYNYDKKNEDLIYKNIKDKKTRELWVRHRFTMGLTLTLEEYKYMVGHMLESQTNLDGIEINVGICMSKCGKIFIDEGNSLRVSFTIGKKNRK